MYCDRTGPRVCKTGIQIDQKKIKIKINLAATALAPRSNLRPAPATIRKLNSEREVLHAGLSLKGARRRVGVGAVRLTNRIPPQSSHAHAPSEI